MPQGISGAPATFQRLMEKTVGDMNLLEVLVYLDDLIVFGKTLEEHEARLMKVLDRLDANPTKPYELHVDASLDGLGAVLYQNYENKWKPVAFVSRGLTASERHYPVHKLEFLALKWAVVDKLHDYLYGATFVVKTDNNPLTYVQTTAKLDATGQRWMAALAAYDFKLQYRSGQTNADADALSRRPHNPLEEESEWMEIPSPAIRATCKAVIGKVQSPYKFGILKECCCFNVIDRKTIQHEVSRFEEQYRGRELPGFTSYKTFEAIVKRQIVALEKPAIEMMKKVMEIVQKSFTEVAKDHFEDFHNLHRAAKDRIKYIITKQAKEAETIIIIHFKMEQLVYCQDNVYRQDLKVIREEESKEVVNDLHSASLKFGFGTAQDYPAIKDMTYHLEAYFHSAGKRLSNQIPLIIQFYILQDCGDKLHNSMLQLLQEKEKLSFFLQERKDSAYQREILSGRINRLTQARLRLIQFSVI
ncbi:interferon-induced GTP-binding protein Mx1-like [Pelodiscus sinensis]|uniref:interferon-induced GTP-binding protein Mx1-like n=1 Tax=Pelodiscus sinensis TaxID=13735 RepID=UPI003F6C171C